MPAATLAHEIFHASSRSVQLAFSGGDLKVREADSSSAYAVRCLSEGRLGFAYCQQQEDLQKTIQEAEHMARFSVKSGFSFAPKATAPSLDINDSALDAETLVGEGFGALRAFVEEAREAAASKGGKPRVVASVDSAAVGLENSSGFSGSYGKTALSIYIECMHNDGYGSSFLASNRMPKSASQAGFEAAEMAQAMQGAGKPEAGTYTVVMEVESLDSIIDTVSPSLSGDWKRRGITKLKAGTKQFSELLTISDDGTAGGVSARPFDDEGTPSSRRPLVDKGVVSTFLFDRETAALAGVEESGFCTRETYDSPPSIGGSNVVISPGERKDLSDIDRHLEVHYAQGSHTANISSGDIGLEVSAAFLVEKGKRKPVKGFMLSGNVFDMLSNIEAIESTQKVFGSLISPRIAFRDVRVVS